MSTRGTGTHGTTEATGIPWETRTSRLDELRGREMTHAQLEQVAAEQLEGVVDNHEWWAQAVAVAYEQHTGARRPGPGRGRHLRGAREPHRGRHPGRYARPVERDRGRA